MEEKSFRHQCIHTVIHDRFSSEKKKDEQYYFSISYGKPTSPEQWSKQSHAKFCHAHLALPIGSHRPTI